MPGATADADHAADWYAAEDPEQDLDAEFLAEVKRVAQLIGEHPLAWTEIEPGIRHAVLRRFPYSLIYALEPTKCWSSRWPTNAVELATGATGSRANPRHSPPPGSAHEFPGVCTPMTNEILFAGFATTLLHRQRHRFVESLDKCRRLRKQRRHRLQRWRIRRLGYRRLGYRLDRYHPDVRERSGYPQDQSASMSTCKTSGYRLRNSSSIKSISAATASTIRSPNSPANATRSASPPNLSTCSPTNPASLRPK